MEKEIYLDNSATTPICKEALETYFRLSTENYGNPSSRHFRGQMANAVLKEARKTILSTLRAKDGDILFTSGGTEANNMAIQGRAHAKERFKNKGKILTTMGEHSSVSHTLDALAREGFEVITVPTPKGVLDLSFLANAADAKTILGTFMMVNNETGAKYQVKEAADIIHRASPDGAVHLDATQSYMKFPFSASSVGADMITVSSHKIEGPKGVGALYVGAGLLKSKGLSPIVFGGGQEDGLRSGTENVPGIGAFAEAARVYFNALPQRYQAVNALREYLVEKVSAVCGIEVNLPSGDFAPHIVSLTVRGMKSETVLNDLSGRKICVSAGSACSSHDKRLSSALLAFGKTPDEADSTIRVSLSFRNTKEELDTFVAALVDVIRVRAKKLSLD